MLQEKDRTRVIAVRYGLSDGCFVFDIMRVKSQEVCDDLRGDEGKEKLRPKGCVQGARMSVFRE